ncbi:hypothetical protein ACFV9C_44325 [Kribbella sp. NPDC059898]|uniref:hypothetical protein n=1 Tax=Kribbella sp. NPDC059898 TaxID=3346995 RepID=UPI00364EB3AC
MYGNTSRFVVLPLSPVASCSPGDRAELIRSLEAERIPNGLAFISDPSVARTTDELLSAVVAQRNALDDSLPATKARRDALLAALDEPAAALSERRKVLEDALHESPAAEPGLVDAPGVQVVA